MVLCDQSFGLSVASQGGSVDLWNLWPRGNPLEQCWPSFYSFQCHKQLSVAHMPQACCPCQRALGHALKEDVCQSPSVSCVRCDCFLCHTPTMTSCRPPASPKARPKGHWLLDFESQSYINLLFFISNLCWVFCYTDKSWLIQDLPLKWWHQRKRRKSPAGKQRTGYGEVTEDRGGQDSHPCRHLKGEPLTFRTLRSKSVLDVPPRLADFASATLAKHAVLNVFCFLWVLCQFFLFHQSPRGSIYLPVS